MAMKNGNGKWKISFLLVNNVPDMLWLHWHVQMLTPNGAAHRDRADDRRCCADGAASPSPLRQ